MSKIFSTTLPKLQINSKTKKLLELKKIMELHLPIKYS